MTSYLVTALTALTAPTAVPPYRRTAVPPYRRTAVPPYRSPPEAALHSAARHHHPIRVQ